MFLYLVIVVTHAIALFTPLITAQIQYPNQSNNSNTAPPSSGFKLQHGFETLLVQPFGYDGFRVRAWPFRPPNGNEISFLYDPPLEGPENGKAHGMTFDTYLNGNSTFSLRNGNTVVQTNNSATGAYRLSFWRVESDGAYTLLTNEYQPLKSVNSRYYSWGGAGSEFSAAFSWSTTPDEQIYGTGTQQDHVINKKGQVIDLINFNSQIPTPVFMSSKGYAMVWNSPAEGRMEFGTHRMRITSDSTTVVDYVVVSAPPGNYDQLQQRLTALTGRAPLPPDFSLGYLHSKLRYENQSEVIQLAENFVKYKIPVSLIVIDFQSWAYQGDWSLDAGLFPDVAGMSAQVKKLTGAEMMASLWPSVEDASPNYATMQANGYLSATRSGPGVTDSWNGSYIRNYDATNADARAFLCRFKFSILQSLGFRKSRLGLSCQPNPS